MLNGRFVQSDWLGQPIYAPATIAVGIAVILFALAPSSWLDRI